MARGHGRILTSIWEDPDFLALNQAQQRLYLFLISQPNLNHAGLLPLTLRRWARKAAGLTVEDLEKVLTELEQRRFVVIDQDTEELLIRTFVRNDGVWRMPKVMAAMVSGAEEISSPKLRRVLLDEMDRLPLDQLSDEPGARGQSVRRQIHEHLVYLRQSLHVPDPNPPGDPSGRASDTPAEPFAKGTETLPDTPRVPTTRAHAATSRAPSPAPAPAPAPTPTPFAGAPALEASPPDDLRPLPDRMLDAWWTEHHTRTAQNRRAIRAAIATALDNGLDPDELWAALARLAETNKPITGGTLTFALADVRKPADVIHLADRQQQATDDLFDAAMARAEKRMQQESS